MTRPSDAELTELIDKQKLQENLFFYCRGIDRMDEELIRSTYWPDSTDDHGVYDGSGPGWAKAGVAWKDNCTSVNHHVSNVLIELDGNQAKRESMFLCVSNYKEPAISAFLGGRYRDLCEKRDGEWKILTRVCIWDWYEQRPTAGGWEQWSVPQKSNWGYFAPDDPIYGPWNESRKTAFPRPMSQFHTHSQN